MLLLYRLFIWLQVNIGYFWEKVSLYKNTNTLLYRYRKGDTPCLCLCGDYSAVSSLSSTTATSSGATVVYSSSSLSMIIIGNK